MVLTRYAGAASSVPPLMTTKIDPAILRIMSRENKGPD